MSKRLKASILIPWTRKDSLKKCEDALFGQSFKDFEIITNGEKGPLAEIRNRLAHAARGKVLVFIDDDTVPTRRWLESILYTFVLVQRCGGVSGPSVISRAMRRNRDIFSYAIAKKFYDEFFCDGGASLPGHISSAGAWTTGACHEECDYEGPVDFLEACNMAVLKDAFVEVGGFDEAYGGLGEWSEPDLCFRIRQKGYRLWFHQGAKLYHEPSQSGAYIERQKVKSRLENYELFWSRWCKPNWRLHLYKLFVRGYFAYKASK